MKISVKLTLLIISCIILVSLSIGIASSLLMEKYLLEQVTTRLNETSNFISSRTRNFIAVRENEINQLSKNRSIALFLTNPKKNDTLHIQELLLTLASNYNALIIMNKAEKKIIEVVDGKVIKLRGKYHTTHSAPVIKKGNIYYQYNTGNKNNNLIDLYISRKISNKNKENIGVITGKINYTNFYNMLEKTYIEAGFITRIINNNNNSLLCGYSGAWPNKSIKSASVAKGLDWTIEIALPHETFVQKLRTLRLSIFIITTCTVVLTLLLFNHFLHQISRQISSISKAAKSIAEGNFHTHINISSKNEIGTLAASFNQMATKLKNSNNKMNIAHQHAIQMLAIASEYKNPKTYEHVMHIKDITIELAKELGIEQKLALQMGTDSLLHDLGKIGISNNILLKTNKLTKEEFETVKQHSLIGARIIGDHEWFEQARIIAISHHEKWDGSGYPNNLKGNNIPFPARIVAVADVFDVLISERPYKRPWKIEKAVEEIKRKSGKHFDPKVVKAFISLYEQGRFNKFAS